MGQSKTAASDKMIAGSWSWNRSWNWQQVDKSSFDIVAGVVGPSRPYCWPRRSSKSPPPLPLARMCKAGKIKLNHEDSENLGKLGEIESKMFFFYLIHFVSQKNLQVYS